MKRYMLTTVALGLLSSLAILAPPGQAPGRKAAAPLPIRPQAEKAADATRIDQLIQRLGSDDFAERETAGKALEAIGAAALPALRKAQDNYDVEIRRRVRDLIGVQKQRRSAMRAKAWEKFKRLGQIGSDTGTPDGQIGGISLFNDWLRDEDLAWLQWIDEMEGLRISGLRITDAGLVHVKKLHMLRILDLKCTKVTGAGLAHLKALDSLNCLLLRGTRVTDAGLVHLKALKNLWHLDLGYTQITDDGIDQVKDIKTLTRLKLDHTQVSDAGLAKLKGLNL